MGNGNLRASQATPTAGSQERGIQAREIPRLQPTRTRNGPIASSDALTWALAALAFALALLRYDGPARGYWDTYIAAPAMLMAGEAPEFVLADGKPAYAMHLRGVLPEDLVGPRGTPQAPGYGTMTRDQRIGTAMLAAPPYLALGLLGFALLFALAAALVVPMAVLVVRAWQAETQPLETTDQGHGPALLGAAVLAFNPYMLSIDRLNPNVFALPLVLLLLWLALARKPAWQLGIVLGVLAGMREEAVCFVPVLAWWQARGPKPLQQRLLPLAQVGLATLFAMLPAMVYKAHAFGSPFVHPSQYAHHEGWRPEFLHGFMGLSFTFNGLLNWPLHETLVRTPHFAFPVMLLWPLVTLRALGLGLSALALCGAVRLRRDVLVLLLGFSLPIYGLFALQENWEEVKMTFLLLALGPLPVLVAAGAQALRGPDARRTGLAVVAVALLLFAGVQVAGQVQAPQDPRWQVRFPNADPKRNPDVQRGLEPGARNDWRFFQSTETPADLARERAKLTAGLPWPAPYLPTACDPYRLACDGGRSLQRLADQAGQRRLRVLDVWGYIYGTRRWPVGRLVEPALPGP